MSRFHDDSTFAEHPGHLRLDRSRFRRLQPETRGLRGLLHRLFGDGRRFEAILDEHMQLGDSRAASVISLEPLLVAAYTDELDCVTVLLFPPYLIAEHQLCVGTRLLTVNTYGRGRRVVADLEPGPAQLGRWVNFFPVIAEFVSGDRERIEARKSKIEETEWTRCHTLGLARLRGSPQLCRDGSPLRSSLPAQSWM